MGSLVIKTDITVTDDNGKTQSYPFNYNNNNLGETSVRNIPITASSTTIIWDPTNWTGFTPSSFSALIMISSIDIYCEMTVNEGDANEELNSFTISSNVPFMLGSNAAYYNHSASDVFSGSLDVIDKIRIKEFNATTGNLLVILVKNG